MADRKEYMKNYYLKNKEKHSEKAKENYMLNREQRLQKGKEWVENNKEHRRQYEKQYREKNKEKNVQYKKEYYNNLKQGKANKHYRSAKSVINDINYGLIQNVIYYKKYTLKKFVNEKGIHYFADIKNNQNNIILDEKGKVAEFNIEV